MSTLGKIVYLSEAQASELFANGSITVDGTTITYSADDLYLTPENIEYVNKSGDTMTGTLTAPEIRIKNDSYPSFYYQTTSGIIGRTLVNHTSHNMSFREMKSGQHFDSFTLPTPTITETTDNYYNILTNKDWLAPVSVTTGVSRVTVQYNNSFKFLGKLVVVNVRLSIATGTAIPVNSGVCNVQQAAYVPAFPGDTGTYATIAAAPYGPFKISPNGTVTATVQIPADYTGTITMSGVFFAS